MLAAPAGAYAAGDQLLCDGTRWTHIFINTGWLVGAHTAPCSHRRHRRCLTIPDAGGAIHKDGVIVRSDGVMIPLHEPDIGDHPLV